MTEKKGIADENMFINTDDEPDDTPSSDSSDDNTSDTPAEASPADSSAPESDNGITE